MECTANENVDYEVLVDWAMAPERDISGWDWSIKPSTIP